MISYTDPLGKRTYKYAKDLIKLREKEEQFLKDQMDGMIESCDNVKDVGLYIERIDEMIDRKRELLG